MSFLRHLTHLPALAAIAMAALAGSTLHAQSIVHVDTHGATPNDASDDDAFEINVALFLLFQQPPPYELHFTAGGVYGMDISTSAALFQVTSRDDLTVVGNGATLNVRGFDPTRFDHAGVWDFRDCDNLEIRDLRFDMGRKPFSTGTVTSVITDNLTPPTLTEVQLDMDQSVPDVFVVRWITSFDDGVAPLRFDGHALSRGGYYVGNHYTTMYLQPGRPDNDEVQINFLGNQAPLAANVVVGDRLVISHQKFSAHVFSLDKCQDVLLEGIEIPAGVGSGAFVTDCEDVTFRDWDTTPDAGDLLALTGDCLHIVRPRGDVTVEDSTFTRLGDDGVNVHASWYEVVDVVEVLDEQSGLPTHWNVYVGETEHAFRALAPPAGLWTFVRSNLAPNLSAMADAVTCVDDPNLLGSTWVNSCTDPEDLPNLWCLEYPFEPDVDAGDYAMPDGHLPNSVAIRNCVFSESLYRGGFLSVPGIVVEDCTFENLGGPAVALQTDVGRFYEGPGANGAQVLDCTITDVNYGRQRTMGAISIYATYGPGSNLYSPPGVLSDILIERNEITDTPFDGIFVASATGVDILHNGFTDVATSPVGTVTDWHEFLRPDCLTTPSPSFQERYFAVADYNANGVFIDWCKIALLLYQQGGAVRTVPCGTGSYVSLGSNNLLY